MLRAHKIAWFERLFTRHCGRMLRGQFAGVRVLGLPRVQRALAAGPLLLAANHVAFWDGILITWLSNALLQAEGYAWMDGNNLRGLAFFRLLGAFGVRPGRATDTARAMRYAQQLLSGPGRHVWLFPQGRERPVSVRPLGLQRGSAHLMRRCPQATLLPVALRYEFGAGMRPWVHVAFGEPFAGEHQVHTHAAALEAVLAEQEADLLQPTAHGREFLRRGAAAPGWPTRLLSFLAQRFMQLSPQIDVQGARPPAHPASPQHAAPGNGQQEIGP